MSEQNPFIDALARYRNKTDGAFLFVVEVLGADPDEWQTKALLALSRGERRMSIRSGHGVGKSTFAAWAMLWKILCFYTVKVVVTAPTSAQLYDALAAEVKRWVNVLPEGWKQLLDVKSDRIELLAAPNEAFISFRTARAEAPEALQGVHADNVLLIADEASGVAEAVFEAAIGSMSSDDATTLLLGNPTRTSGFFFDTHHKNRDKWWTLRVSCVDSKRVSRDFISEVADTYGELSNAYRVRVLGEFPASDDDTIIPLWTAEASVGRDIVPDAGWSWIWGLDCARFGDDSSVLTKMWGSRVVRDKPLKWVKLDTMQLAGRVQAEWLACHPQERPVEINVDAIGIGAGVADRLREMGLPARAVNVSESPGLKNEYKNLRTELWFKGRDFFAAANCSLPEGCEVLIADLVSVKYSVADSSGLLLAEPKAETKKRLRRSPDYADSFLLCLASDGFTARYGSAQSSNWNKPLRRGLKMA
jgi:phage terminase large subunit